MQRRKVEINNNEFYIWGTAPWAVIAIPKSEYTPQGYIVIEAKNITTVIKNKIILNKSLHRYNALSRISEKGAVLPVAFVGPEGKARAEEIVTKLNFKLG